MNRNRGIRRAVALLSALVFCLSGAGAESGSWSEDLDILATEREKSLFSSLDEAALRERFLTQFWLARDPFPQTSRNELREEWDRRVVTVRERWGSLADDRSRVFLLQGEPSSRFEAHCPASGSFEVWTYEPGFRKEYRTVLVFLPGDGGRWRLWRPGSSPDVTAAAAEPCSDQAKLRREAEWILRAKGRGEYGAVIERALSRPRPREWTSLFRTAAAEAPASVPTEAPASAPAAAGALAALPSRRPELRLLAPPGGSWLIGQVRFSAEVEQAPEAPPGERIERVAFAVDGKPLLTRNHPPFEVALDLGPVPRPRRLRAEGIAAGGAVVARDELLVNGGTRDFRVRLLEPRPGRPYRQSLHILAEVTAPPGAAVERLELWFGEERIATLRKPPYSFPFVLPQAGKVGYLRAVAYLAGGASCEDVVFVNMPAEPDEMDVRVVELYATVADRLGKPVTGGLDAAAFVVEENGVRQPIREVRPAGDTPVRVVTLIDSSASMAEEIGLTRQAALGFLKSLLRPQDQAAVISFNQSPEVTVPLTGDLGQLEEGLQWVLAEGTTALYDSLVYALVYLGGTRGQRAVLLLSDGLDRTSRLGFEEALEAARRTGIAVYAIGLGLPDGAQGEAAHKLARLARVTGGQSFFARDATDLAGIYGRIEEELRGQYRISYQSSHTAADGAFRSVRLRLAKGGLEARTISGYYP